MNNTQITTKSSAIRTFFRGLRKILIALAIVALGGIAAMNAIQKEVDGKGKAVANKIKDDITTPPP